MHGSGSKLYIQGKPRFSDNFTESELDNATNGGDKYEFPRQDIYLDQNTSSALNNIVVTGNITSGEGSIWVWARSPEHYLIDKQFATIKNGVELTDGILKAFRNAVDDDTTENSSGHYLTGARGNNDSYIYWGMIGSYRVILRKVVKSGERYNPVSGKSFTICREKTTTPVVVDDVPLSGIESQSSGIIWIGDLPYGKYTVYEGNVNKPEATFTIEVGEDGFKSKEIRED